MDRGAPWASRVVDAVTVRYHEVEAEVELVSAAAPTPVSVELVFRYRGDVHLRGITLDESAVRQGPELLRDSSAENLASYLLHVGISEPRALADFLAPDEDGIAWLPGAQWLDDVGGRPERSG